MRNVVQSAIALVFLAAAATAVGAAASARQAVILGQEELDKLVPAQFYFEGQLGPTQMRNAAGVRVGEKRHFIAALVDTSGYASTIRSKYEGFIISDVKFTIAHSGAAGGPGAAASADLPAGAYGFGFTDDLKINIFDIGGNKLQTIGASRDEKLQSPRPLALVKSGDKTRLYRGRSFVEISAK